MKPQLAKHLYLEEEKKKPSYQGNYVVFEKYDGWFGYYDTGDSDIRSRAGRAIPSVRHLVAEFQGLAEGRYIFEIMLENVKDFPTLNGILNRSVGAYKAEHAYLICHDFIKESREEQAFYHRYNQLGAILHGYSEKLRTAPVLTVTADPLRWKAHAEEVWERGGEGVILKRVAAPYQPGKRNHNLMKIKEDITLDLVVVDMVEGEGKYKGTLGALVVEDQEGYQHNVSGMTDAQRHEWWNDQNKILGQIVEIKAMKRLKDGSLREPRFKAIRYDKTETD
jgi:ATP-dependent DNA ligase